MFVDIIYLFWGDNDEDIDVDVGKLMQQVENI